MPYHVIVIHAGSNITSSGHVQQKKPDLKQLQEAVGGYIETVPHFTKFLGLKRGTAFCNEDGLSLGLPFNEEATKAWLDNLGKGPFRYEPRLHGDVIFYAKAKD